MTPPRAMWIQLEPSRIHVVNFESDCFEWGLTSQGSYGYEPHRRVGQRIILPTEGCLSCPEISTHVTYGLTSFPEENACEQWSPFQLASVLGRESNPQLWAQQANASPTEELSLVISICTCWSLLPRRLKLPEIISINGRLPSPFFSICSAYPHRGIDRGPDNS